MAMPQNENRLSINSMYDGVVDIESVRRRSELKLRNTFESLFQKYSQDMEEDGDIVDLRSGRVVEDNGHLRRMRHDTDVGLRRPQFRKSNSRPKVTGNEGLTMTTGSDSPSRKIRRNTGPETATEQDTQSSPAALNHGPLPQAQSSLDLADPEVVTLVSRTIAQALAALITPQHQQHAQPEPLQPSQYTPPPPSLTSAARTLSPACEQTVDRTLTPRYSPASLRRHGHVSETPRTVPVVESKSIWAPDAAPTNWEGRHSVRTDESDNELQNEDFTVSSRPPWSSWSDEEVLALHSTLLDLRKENCESFSSARSRLENALPGRTFTAIRLHTFRTFGTVRFKEIPPMSSSEPPAACRTTPDLQAAPPQQDEHSEEQAEQWSFNQEEAADDCTSPRRGRLPRSCQTTKNYFSIPDIDNLINGHHEPTTTVRNDDARDHIESELLSEPSSLALPINSRKRKHELMDPDTVASSPLETPNIKPAPARSRQNRLSYRWTDHEISKGPNMPLIVQGPDGSLIIIICKWCGRDNFSNVHGALLHCTRKHDSGYLDQDAVVEDCGKSLSPSEVSERLRYRVPEGSNFSLGLKVDLARMIAGEISELPSLTSPSSSSSGLSVNSRPASPNQSITRFVPAAIIPDSDGDSVAKSVPSSYEKPDAPKNHDLSIPGGFNRQSKGKGMTGRQSPSKPSDNRDQSAVKSAMMSARRGILDEKAAIDSDRHTPRRESTPKTGEHRADIIPSRTPESVLARKTLESPNPTSSKTGLVNSGLGMMTPSQTLRSALPIDVLLADTSDDELA